MVWADKEDLDEVGGNMGGFGLVEAAAFPVHFDAGF